MKLDCSRNQYFTPTWAAECIVAHYYPHLTSADTVFDIGCGDGRFLMALPAHVNAVGFEIDAKLAEQAVNNSGRKVIVGDFNQVPFPDIKPTLFLGNPPFEMKAVNGILDRAYEALDYGKEAAFLLPVYFFQTANSVVEYSRHWSLKHDLMPRNLFQGMMTPIMFARFIKERKTTLVGMFLYEETKDVLSLKKKYRTKFLGNESSTHLWGEVIDEALLSLGGRGTVQQIYAEVSGNRPTDTAHWKAQIRKVLQKFYRRVARATYELEPAHHCPIQLSIAL